jgi:hypothetical protein
MKKKLLAVLVAGSCFQLNSLAQSVSINTNGTPPDPSAMLDVSSLTKGVLFPRMTTAERDAIVAPATGLVVFDISLNALFIYRNGAWSLIGKELWLENSPNIYFNTGNVGIKTTTPATSLHIRSGSAVSLVNHGMFLLGNEALISMAFDNDEIQARESGAASPLVLQRYGSMVQIGAGVQNVTTNLYIPQGADAGLDAASSGYVMMGGASGQNIVMDNNEIQSRTNSAVSTLFLQQEGGVLQTGISSSQNIWFQGSEIQGRNNGSTGTLFLQNDGGRLQIGTPLSQYTWIERNEIQGRSGAINFELVLQNDGSRVRIGNATDAGNAKLLITGGSDLSLADNASGFLMMGPIDGVNMVLDNNEIQARNNGAAASLTLNNNGGGVRIGSADIPAGFMLSVDGNIICEELQVKLSGDWADYVFDKKYKLMTLEEVEQYILRNKHLPNIPAASEIEKKGLAVGDMQKMQMEKIEELTLYIIELNKQMKELKADNEKMKRSLSELQKN